MNLLYSFGSPIPKIIKGENKSGGLNAASAKPGEAVRANGHKHHQQVEKKENGNHFQMPLHYPRYKKSDYETMPEWKLDCLLKQYGLPVIGDVSEKRKFAMGSFLWPSQIDE